MMSYLTAPGAGEMGWKKECLGAFIHQRKQLSKA
jgi:hypothetical protein